MKKTHDLKAIVGEYTNKAGETKKRYITIGAVLENEKGMSIKIESIPVGWNGWAGAYIPQEKTQDAQSGNNQTQNGNAIAGMLEDISF